MAITARERQLLRELAKRQAEIAALPVMARREARWYGLNDGATEYPLVTMEFHGLEREVYPPLTCEDPLANALERQLLYRIFKHETYGDDRVIPNSVSVPIQNRFIPFDYVPGIIQSHADDGSEGLGYAFEYVVRDLREDFGAFKRSTFRVDAGLSEANALKAQAEEVLGDILPVRLEFSPLDLNPAYTFLRMMGMQVMFCAILDYPDLFHQIMRSLTDDYHAYLNAIEAGGAFTLNNDSSCVNQDSYGFTHDLPSGGDSLGPYKLSDLWGYANAQEMVGMTEAMYDEFFFTYNKEITDRFGLISFGCCEPVHNLWEPCLSRMVNLRKVSVSPWCDEEALGEMIRGKRIVYHRKPFPNYISVDSVFNEPAFLEHMKRTVLAARGNPLEVTFRDITTVHGEPWRLTRAVELTREAFERWWQG